MTCDPCKITVNPQTVGFTVDYLRGGTQPEFKFGGIVVKPEVLGINITTCQIPPTTAAQIPVPELIVEGISATVGDPDIVISFSEELDPLCDWENGVTITVDGVPATILSVTANGSADPWGYDYEIDIVPSVGDTVVWTYDASAGDLCALSGTTLGDATISTTAVTTPGPAIDNYQVWMNGDNFDLNGNLIEGWLNDSTASLGASADLDRVFNTMTLTQKLGFNVARSPDSNIRFFEPDVATINILDGFTVFVVGAFEGVNDGAAMMFSSTLGSSNQAIIDQDLSNIKIRGDDAGLITQIPNDTSAHVFAMRFDSGNHRARISGSSWATAATGAQNWDYGAFLARPTTPIQVIGWIGEIFVYTRALSDSEMNAQYSWLLDKWGL